jgi:hypothetical protein
MHPFCNNGWAYYEKVQEIMPLYARGTTLFHPAEGPPVSVNGGVDSGAIMIGGGGSREAGGGNGRDDIQCKGTSVRFLTSPLLSHFPPVHMYFPYSLLYHLQGLYLKPTTFRPDGPTTFQKSTHQ